MRWNLTVPGLVMLLLMAALMLAGLHMIARPHLYVGKGPIPAGSAANVRVMGLLFAILGGFVTAMFTLPMLLR